MIELLKAYNEYRYREYESEQITLDEFIKEIKTEKGVIYITYTEDDNGVPMQTAYDLKHEEYITLYNEEEKERKKVELEYFIQDLLYCDFDDFIRDCWEYVKEGE